MKNWVSPFERTIYFGDGSTNNLGKQVELYYQSVSLIESWGLKMFPEGRLQPPTTDPLTKAISNFKLEFWEMSIL